MKIDRLTQATNMLTNSLGEEAGSVLKSVGTDQNVTLVYNSALNLIESQLDSKAILLKNLQESRRQLNIRKRTIQEKESLLKKAEKQVRDISHELDIAKRKLAELKSR